MSKPKKNAAKNAHRKKVQGRSSTARKTQQLLDEAPEVVKDYSMDPYSSMSMAAWFDHQSEIVSLMTSDVLKEYNERQAKF